MSIGLAEVDAGLQQQVCAPRGRPPSDYAPRERVDHHVDVDKAEPRGGRSEVRDPELVRSPAARARTLEEGMTLQRAEVVHTSIAVAPQRVTAWLSDLNNWLTWAPWIRSVSRVSARDWTLVTDVGTMQTHFVEPNSFGVLDHQVLLESGATVFNSMRVLPNGSGSELVMVIFQRPAMSLEEFQRDVQAVTDDLARMKPAAESLVTAPNK
jgi:hypothetical protein